MGEPWQGTSPTIVDSAVESLRAGRTRYAPLAGSPTLREAIVEHLEGRHSRRFAQDQVVCTHGASGGLAATMLTIVRPGDRVVIPEPTYSLYADHVALAGGEVVWVANHPDGSVDVDAVVEALPGARLLVLCSPCNPTGNVVSAPELQELSEAAASVGALLLCDEAYCDIVFDGRSFCSVLDLPESDQVICARTFSKSYAMTGWRLGYVAGPKPLISKMATVHSHAVTCATSFAQAGGVAALEGPQDVIGDMVEAWDRRRRLMADGISAIKGLSLPLPEGAFYAFVDGRETGLDSTDLAAKMLDEAHVAVVPGIAFGESGEGHVRMSYATSDEALQRTIDRLTDLFGSR